MGIIINTDSIYKDDNVIMHRDVALYETSVADIVAQNNPNYSVERMRIPDEKSTTPVFAIKITKEMLEPYKTHKAMGGLVQFEDIFEV